MDCKRARNTMQEALDQRLKAAELKGFQEHVLACKACRQDYGRLRRLRQWTRELPQGPVARDFSARLFDRIRAGEGSPDAIFAAPIPALRQARVFLSGALTAAALLLGFWLLLDTLGRQGATQDGGALPEGFARIEAGAPLEGPGLLRSSPTPVADQVPLAESALDAAWLNYENAQRLRGARPDPELLDQIRVQAIKVHRGLDSLDRLEVVPTKPWIADLVRQLRDWAEAVQRKPEIFFDPSSSGEQRVLGPTISLRIYRFEAQPSGEVEQRFKPKVGLRAYGDEDR